MSGRRFTIWSGSLAGAVGFAALSITASLGARSGHAIDAMLLPAQSGGSGASASIPTTLGWFEVPGSKLQTACPPNDFHGTKYAFALNCSAVIRAWSGGIADTRRNRMILWGGGHSDYAGNEIYAFDLETLRLTRLNDPSPIAECAQATPDGRANARHTYGALAYIAHADRMFVFGGGSYCPRGNSSSDTWTLNLETLEWKRMDPVHGGSPNGENHGTIAAYDSGTKLVYVWDRATGFYSYDYDRNAYKFLSSFTPLGLHANGVVDPKAQLFLAFGDSQIWAVPIGLKGRHSPQDKSKAKGCEGLSRSASPGLAYDPVLDRIVGWPDFGPTVYLYDPATNSCTPQTFAANAPADSAHAGSARTSNGTFGRFQYFPSASVFVLVNDSNINAHTLRLTPPAAPPAAPPAGSVQ